MSSAQDSPSPGDAYRSSVEAIREAFPNVIVVPGIEPLADYLQRHTWCKEDIYRCFPWRPHFFLDTAGRDLPFILNTAAVRAHYKDLMADWPLQTRNARKLYDPEDLLKWFRDHLVSTIDTVLVPLTMFAENPEGMRRTFRRVKTKHLSEALEVRGRSSISKHRLVDWPEIRPLIRRDYQDEVGRIFDDLAKTAEEQGVARNRARLPRFPVKLSADKLPVFFTLTGAAGTRGAFSTPDVGYSTVKFFGWARHELTDAADPKRTHQKIAYTQGLWFGGRECLRDYEEGLTELMTAERFVRLFGLQALQTADWRLSKDLCAWAEPDAQFGPGLPPKAQAVLLGTNWVAPKER